MEADVWTIKRVLEWAGADLRSRSNETPRLDAEVMLAHVLGVDRIGLVTDAFRPLTKEELARYRALHVRRRAGEPVAYLRGMREFYGRPFQVDRRVLIPRPDTETLVDVALEATRAVSLAGAILDLCTGSGCVAITIAAERPTMRVIGTDLSEDALIVARDNAIRLGVADHTTFVAGDLFDALQAADRFDAITANPPYIPRQEVDELAVDIRRFEPHLALSGGDDGMDVTRRIVAGALARLEPEGTLALEVGAGQATDVGELLRAAGYDDVRTTRDFAGIERVVSGRKRA